MDRSGPAAAWRPSVLYDAVACCRLQTRRDLMQEPTARDFVADAFAHCKFIGYVEAALPLFAKAGAGQPRRRVHALEGPGLCGIRCDVPSLRFWAREAVVRM